METEAVVDVNDLLKAKAVMEQVNSRLKTGLHINPVEHNSIKQAYVTLEKAGISWEGYEYLDIWETPIALTMATVEDWPDDLLPPPIDDYAKAVSDSTETPLELAINDILGVLGTVAQRKYEVRVKDGWCEPLSYWGLSIQPPATRKSRVKAHTCSPLIEWEMDKHLELKDEVKEAQSRQKTELKIIEGMRNKAGKIKDKQERQEYMKEIDHLDANLTEVPTIPRLWTDDITPERLASLMSENNQRMGILSAEGGVFGIMAGRYSSGSPNLNIYLKAHAGDAERVDRGTREWALGFSPDPGTVMLQTISKRHAQSRYW